MKRLYQILLIISIALLVLLCLYAIPSSVSPTRPWMETTLGPPLSTAFGSTWTFIITSAPVIFLLANPHLLVITGIIIGIFPISFPIIHRSFNTIRGKAVGSSIKESGLYPKSQAPTHIATQVTPKAETTTQPVTPVAAAPEPKPEPVPPEAEKTE